MARPSSIDRLPEELRETIGRLRASGRTIDEIRHHLETLGADVSRSALGRHTQWLDRLSERMLQSRQVTEALIERLGSAGESRQVRLIAELVGTGMFEALSDASDLTPTEHAHMARAVKDLAQTLRTDAAYTERVRALAAAEAVAAERVRTEGALKKANLTPDTLSMIRSEIYGLAPDPTAAQELQAPA